MVLRAAPQWHKVGWVDYEFAVAVAVRDANLPPATLVVVAAVVENSVCPILDVKKIAN